MHLLVAGADRVDAGKTTFSTGLLAHLRQRGHAPTGFKPRAGNDFWFDHDDALAATREGRLYGKDARRLAAAGATAGPPERINPVHRLWRPTPDRTGLLGEAGRTFLVDRLREADGDRFVVNERALDEGLVPDAVRDHLPLDGATRVDSVPAFNEVMADAYLPAFERLADRVADADPAVVESYADVATPLDGVAYDAVAVVDPGRVRVYDGERYAMARDVAGGSADRGQLEERVGDVVEMVEPLATADLPALSGDARSDPDAVAAAYEDALTTLVQAATE